MISGNFKDTSALIHLILSIQTHCRNLFTKETPNRLDLLADHSFTAMMYIYLDTPTQTLSPL